MTLRRGRDGLSLLGRDSSLRLLLIEDSSSDSQLVLEMLEGEFTGATIEVETSLERALTRMGETSFDLVLADLTLPDAQGAPVVQRLRAAHPDTALMVLTGRVDGDLALWALAEGAQDYLVKGQHDGPRLATALLHALQRRRAEEEAHRYLELARGLLDALAAPTCAIDSDGTIVAVNRAWRDVAELNDGDPEGTGVGSSYLDVCDHPDAERGGLAEAAGVGQGIRRVLDGSLPLYRQDYPCDAPDERRWFTVQVTSAQINDAPGAVVTHLDITDMHVAQESLARHATHDPLTGLPNRLLVVDRVEQAISDAQRHGHGLTLAHLALDKFQRVNDSLGHAAGDLLLRLVVQRLRDRLRPGDTLARVSGDGFVVLWRDLVPDSPGQALARCQELLALLRTPFDVGGVPVTLSASMGVAIPSAGHDAEDLMRAATTAMYDARSRGPGRVQLFTTAMRGVDRRRMSLEKQLREELAGPTGQLVLHYQPVLDLAAGAVVAVEALVRWQHPQHGLLAPDTFIPVAEDAGLMHQLGDWVLTRAITDAPALTDRGRHLDVAVNFSVRQFPHNATAEVRRALDVSGMDPARLILEVTESAFVEDEEATAASLDALSELGVRIAMDDFGTGYSSLLYLRRYPINSLKIDRAIVAGIGENPDDEAICNSIVSLARAVGASSVAEGVETTEQYASLRAMGCVQGQGHLWSPAVAVEDLPAALDACRLVRTPAPPREAAGEEEQAAAELMALVVRMQGEGASMHTIAAALNGRFGSDPRGIRWTAGRVKRMLA